MLSISRDYQHELDAAARLAREAGELTLRYREGDLAVELKPGDEPVTIADKHASELIVAGLRHAFPADVIISEENADDLRRLEAERVWFIDPIDGTKDYIRREDGFCVMIGLAVRHRPTVGVIYQPVSRRLFAAATGAGTWLWPPDGAPLRVTCSTIAELTEARLVASKSHRSGALDQVKSALGIANELNVGSVGLKLALIAVGERDLYVNPSSKTNTWDTCGPEVLLVEAGGRLTDLHGAPLSYADRDQAHRRGLLATNGPLHAAACAKLSPLFPTVD